MNDDIERTKKVVEILLREATQKKVGVVTASKKEIEAQAKQMTTELLPGYCLANFEWVDDHAATFDIEEQPARGYTHCKCRDCFNITIDGGLCDECEEAGCEPGHGCLAPHAYEQHCGDEDCCGPLED